MAEHRRGDRCVILQRYIRNMRCCTKRKVTERRKANAACRTLQPRQTDGQLLMTAYGSMLEALAAYKQSAGTILRGNEDRCMCIHQHSAASRRWQVCLIILSSSVQVYKHGVQ